MRKYLIVVGLALVLAVSGGIGVARNAGQPDAGQSGATAILPSAVVGATGDLTASITTLQAGLRRLPEDYRSWATLALAYVEQARIVGDASLYGRAQEAVERSLSIRPDENFSALAARAALHAARHDFSAALQDADQALAINGYDVGALSVRVDALTELGRYDEQLRALRLADRRQPGVATATRFAYAFELRGELERAVRILRATAASGSVDDRAYVLTILADVERRLGRLESAASHLCQARSAAPGYLPAIVSAARLAVARGDVETAVARWEEAVRRQPLPEYATELGELYLHLGRETEAQGQFGVVDATLRLLDDGGVNTDLEAALFAIDHGSPQVALEAAREEWSRRKSIHVADVLAWALHRSGDDNRALRLARRATSLGTAEARLWIHRGVIEASLGLQDQARRHLRRGLSTDPGLSPWQADLAQTTLEKLENQS